MGALPHVISFNQESAQVAIQRDPLAAYLAALKTENKSLRTLKAYRADLEAFRVWLGCPVEQADAPTLLKYFSTLDDLSPATRARKQTSLAMFFRWCISLNVLQVDPMAATRRTKIPKRLPRPLDDDRLKRFFLALADGHTRDKLLFTMLAETGLRISECLGLQWEDVDLTPNREQLRVLGKGQKERVIPLENAEVTLAFLRKMEMQKDKSSHVFVGQNGQALSYSRTWELFRHYADEAGLSKNVTIHAFRHTHATNLLEDGVNILVVQRLLGHAKVETTSLYQLVSDQFVRKELAKRKSRLLTI